MKILLVNKFFYLNGGSETVFFQERDHCLKSKHDVIDFSMKDEKNLSSPFEGCFVPNIDYKNSGHLLYRAKQALSFIHAPIAIEKMGGLIKKENPEIAHLHNIYHQLTPSIIPVLKKAGVKIVLTLHDYKLACPSYLALNKGEICNACKGRYFWEPFITNCQNSYSKSLLLSIEAFFHKWKGSYDAVDLFLAPSQFMAKQISQRIPRDKIQILQNGINTDDFQPEYNHKGYILYFGRLSKEKGIKTLLKAHASLSQPFPLKIAGTGPLLPELTGKYRNVEFLGYKSGKELNSLIANAAFVVSPSEWYENCSMVVLEAMALGKPVIGSKIGGIPEQIEDNITGLLFESGNIKELTEKMEYLASHDQLRREMGMAARKKLEKEFSLQKHCESLIEIYENLLK